MKNKYFSPPKIFSDRELLSGLPVHVSAELKLRGLTLAGAVEKVSFVGILKQEEGVSVFLPRSVSKVSQPLELTQASYTLKAVEKYGRESKASVDLMDEGDGKKTLISLALLVNCWMTLGKTEFIPDAETSKKLTKEK